MYCVFEHKYNIFKASLATMMKPTRLYSRVNFHNSKNAVLFSTAYIHKLCLYYVHCFASLTCEIGTTRFRMYGRVECYLESKTDTRHVGSNCVKTSIPKSYFLKLCFCVGFGLRKKNFLIGKWYTVTKVWKFHFT